MATFIVGCVPNGAFKRWLNHWAYTATFRILARSLSVVLTFHNPEYQPRGAGICVANHTTPVDVVIVSTESCFSLVSESERQIFRPCVSRLCAFGVGDAMVAWKCDVSVCR